MEKKKEKLSPSRPMHFKTQARALPVQLNYTPKQHNLGGEQISLKHGEWGDWGQKTTISRGHVADLAM